MVLSAAFVAIAGMVLAFALPAATALAVSFVLFGTLACLLLGHWAWLRWRINPHTNGKRRR